MICLKLYFTKIFLICLSKVLYLILFSKNTNNLKSIIKLFTLNKKTIILFIYLLLKQFPKQIQNKYLNLFNLLKPNPTYLAPINL
jgi:hypothetical protein